MFGVALDIKCLSWRVLDLHKFRPLRKRIPRESTLCRLQLGAEFDSTRYQVRGLKNTSSYCSCKCYTRYVVEYDMMSSVEARVNL